MSSCIVWGPSAAGVLGKICCSGGALQLFTGWHHWPLRKALCKRFRDPCSQGHTGPGRVGRRKVTVCHMDSPGALGRGVRCCRCHGSTLGRWGLQEACVEAMEDWAELISRYPAAHWSS